MFRHSVRGSMHNTNPANRNNNIGFGGALLLIYLAIAAVVGLTWPIWIYFLYQ